MVSSPRARLLLVCALVVAAKLWLVATDEVVARVNPYDQERYLEMAQAIGEGRWLGSYDERALIREPSYPLWLAAVDASVLRLRLANEWLLAAAAALLAFALRRCGLGVRWTAAVFALLVLAPHGLDVNREVLAAGFYLPMLLVAVAGLLLGARAEGAPGRIAAGVLAGLAVGLAWTSRPEKPVLALLLAGFALLEGWRLWAGGRSVRSSGLAVAAVVGPAIALVAAVVVGYASLNERHYGVFATTDLSTPGFVAANRALQGVPHARPRHRLLVPREVRERVYAVSPSFRALRAQLERPGWPAAVSCNRLRICDDLGGAWFMWALREAIAAERPLAGAADLDARFQRIADEIADARAAGALPPPRTSFAVVHPYLSTWLPELPASLWRVLAGVFAARHRLAAHPPRDAPDLDPRVRRLTDAIANRRGDLASNGRARITLRAAGGSDLQLAIHPGPHAPRVRPLPHAPGDGLHVFAFELPARSVAVSRPQIELRDASGAVQRLPLPPEGQRVERGPLRVETLGIEETVIDEGARPFLRRALWLGHAGLALALVAGAFVLTFPAWRRPCAPGLLGLAAALLVGLALARIGLLSVIDAATMPAASTRYVYPAVPVLTSGCLIAVAIGLRRRRGVSS